MQGGFKPKDEEWKQAARPQLLAVEDPQEAGRDIGSGSFNIKAVRLMGTLGTARLAQGCNLLTGSACSKDREMCTVCWPASTLKACRITHLSLASSV